MYETIRGLLDSNEFSVIESFEIPGRPARYSPVPQFLFDSKVGGHLDEKFKSQLWAHQAQALESLERGDNVVISSGTASGKSLVFQVAALHKVLLDPDSRVVVFYPLKALVADQLRSWREMARTLGLNVDVVGQIDGSVAFEKRDEVLQNARIVVMTPDVCQAWLMARLAMPAIRKFVGSLSTLVMDEAHTLEGVFGSNFGFLIRRIIAARNHLIGAETRTKRLQLVAATATISNPGEHMKLLTGENFTVVDHEADGAPHYGQIVAHVACPEGDELIVAKELQHQVLTNGRDGAFITFLDSRKGVETLAMSTQKDIDDTLGGPKVASYRSGFTSEDRQRIEQQLRSGDRRGVVSTSALELGIDFPNLCVGFNVGVPPTRKSYRQRLGRVGRSGQGAFVIIGTPNAFRRYGTSLKEYHDMSVEPSHLYLDNRFIQFAHARCLVEERDALAASVSSLPTRGQWSQGFSDVYSAARPGGSRPPEFDAIAELGGDIPHINYPLRNVGEMGFEIKMNENSESLGNTSQSQALRECYPGATYFHMMMPYEVAGWTYGFRPFIRVRHRASGGSTRPRITTWINTGITSSDIIKSHLCRSDSGFLAESQMLITERVEGYIDRHGEYQSYKELQQRNPNMKARSRNFRTSGVVLCIEADWFKRGNARLQIADRLREVFSHEYSVLPQDIGSAATNITVRDGDGNVWRGGCVAMFDQTYGSLRLTENLYINFDHILERLALAVRSDDDSDEIESIIEQIRSETTAFSASNPFDVGAGNECFTGYEQVFAKGSIVCYRESGAIATDVEIIQPTIMNGDLTYQVKAPSPKPGGSPIRRWVSASFVEPSADADAWEYAWWNRQTEIYENPPDDDDES